MKMTVRHLSQLPAAAAALLAAHPDARIFALYGEMGAGKTTFVKELAVVLDCHDIVTSPTFTLVNEYNCREGRPVYHIDLYRIEDIGEAYDFGIEEYLDGQFYCFLEWPERIEAILPEGSIAVSITVAPDGSRTIKSLAT